MGGEGRKGEERKGGERRGEDRGGEEMRGEERRGDQIRSDERGRTWPKHHCKMINCVQAFSFFKKIQNI